MNVLELKLNISPLEVATRYLGEPEKRQGSSFWYKSPFRQETEPSFVVSHKGFHDFGDNWSGDIIDFIQRLYNISFKEAIEFLKREYGFTENEYENAKIRHIKQKQMVQRQRKQVEAEEWFNRIYGYLCDMWKKWEECLAEFEPLSSGYAYAQNRIFILDYWIDYFLEHTSEKERLYDERDDIEWKIKYQTSSIIS